MKKYGLVKKKLLSVTTVAFVAAALASCGGAKDVTAPVEYIDGKKFYIIKTWSRSDCTDAPFVVGEKMGFFEEEGIKMVYTGQLQPPQRIASILNGNNYVGTAHPNTIAIAREGGAAVRGVARSMSEPPDSITDINLQHMWWVTDKNGPYQSWDDIKAATDAGRRVKIQLLLRNACIDYLTDKILAKYDINPRMIQYITMPDIEGVLALKRGLVDMSTPHPPFYNATMETGIANILTTSRDVGGENAGTYFYYFSDNFINNPANHEAIRRFVRAVKRAERWANDNMEQTAKWTEEVIGVPVQANHYYTRDARINREHVAEWIEGSITSGALPKNTRVTVDDVITHDFEEYGDDV